jgi:CBS domain-containing protein/GTP:adenosylcobinamide-phosphate guanylyltransferase
MLPLNEVDLASITVPVTGLLRAAVVAIDQNQRGIALVIDENRRLVGTITDGDVRRAMLAGRTLDMPIADLLSQKVESPYPQPVTALAGTEPSVLLQIMHEHVVRQIPLVDAEGRAVGVVTLDDLVPDQPLALQAVIMAGGFGSRLMPLTQETPKPMLPVGDKPLMEIIIGQLRQAGIRQVNVTTHYQRDKIKAHFGDGQNHGVALKYVDEDTPLGTAGALALMGRQDEPLLVINGDILTDVDFRAMLHFHREHCAEMTVAVRKYDIEVPYGASRKSHNSASS